MRLFEIENSVPNEDEVLAFIFNNCKPYLEQNPQMLPMYRGSKRYKGIEIVSAPVDRKPKDSFRGLHNFLNELIASRNLKANRSNSIFVTGNSRDATSYGSIYVVYPIGNFSFTWSSVIDDATLQFTSHRISRIDSVNDLFGNVENTQKNRLHYFKNRRPRGYQLNQDAVEAIAKTYTDEDLIKAIKSKNEIMLTGDKFLMVPYDTWEEKIKSVLN